MGSLHGSRLPAAPCCWHPVIESLKQPLCLTILTPSRCCAAPRAACYRHQPSEVCTVWYGISFSMPKGHNTPQGHTGPALRCEEEQLLDFVLVGTV